MNNHVLSRALWIGAIAVAITLAIGFVWSRSTPVATGNLSGAAIGGPFSLTDQNGKPVTDRDFAGRYRLMYFGYTSCPDVCPTDVAEIARALKTFAAAHPADIAKVAPMFITVDPERDDPAALKAFVGAFDPRLIGLTGTRPQIDAVLKAYGIYAKKVPETDAQHYLMDHVAVVYLFGPKGEPIAFLSHGMTGAEIAKMLATYVH